MALSVVVLTMFFSTNLSAQITQRGSSTTASNATTNATTITINKPTGVVAGDVLLFSVVQNETDNDNGGLTSPNLSGWTLVKDQLIRSDGTGNNQNAWFGSIYYRVSDGSEGASFTFAMNSRCDMAIGSMVAFSGVACNAQKPDGSAGGPFDITPGTFNNADSATATATGVTVANNNSAVIMFAMCKGQRTFGSWSNSQTELFDNGTADGDDASVGAAWLSSVNSGSTGNRTVTLSASDRNSAILLVLRRATNMTVGAASSTPTLCVNTALTNITHTTTGATGIGTATGLPTGVTPTWASNTITISGTPTASGTFNYTIPLTGGCGSVNATGTIVVSASPVVTAAANTTTFCGSGTVDFTGTTNISAGTTVLGNEDFENSSTYTAVGGSTKTGTSGSGDRPASASFVGSPTTSYWVNNGSATVTTQNFTGLQNGAAKTVSMHLASFSLGATNNGADGADNVWVDISLDGGSTYSREIEVNGNGNSFWSFSSGTGVASVTYDGNNSATVFAPAGGGARTTDGFKLLQITLPTSATQVRVRVRLFNNSGNEAWIIDDIVVSQTIVSPTYSWTSNPSGFTSALQNPPGVTVSASTTYTLTATNPLNGCSGSDNVAITVTPNNTATAGSSTPTVCVNTALTNITHTTTGATGIGTATGLPTGVTPTWASNTITISGTPTATGTFNYTIPLTGGCGSVNATGTITVIEGAMTAGAPSSTPTLCQNTALTNITHTTTGATGIGTATGLPTGVTPTWASNTITISGTPSASGTFNYTIPLTGGCSSVNATGTITVTAPTSAGTLSGTQELCPNGTTTLSSSVSGGTWSSGDTAVATIDSTTGVVTGVAGGNATMTYTVTGTGGCGNATATRVVTVNSVLETTNAAICAGGSGSLTVTSSCAGTPGQTSGPNNAGTGANRTGVGSTVWSNPGNITAVGTPFATVATGLGGTSNYLFASNYGFSIPANATINGIELTIRRSSQETIGFGNRDNQVRLVKNNNIEATNKAVGGVYPTDLTNQSYGNATDLWGTTWTPADINNALFGAVLSVNNTNLLQSRTATVDFMQITVTYTIPGSLQWYTVSSGGTAIGSGSTFNPVGVANSGLANTNTAGTTSYWVGCTTNGGCRTKADFVITPTNTAGSGSSTPTLCVNTALTNITHTTTGATGIGTATGLPAGVTAAWASDTITISGTPTTAGEFSYTIPLTGGCGSVNATGTIQVTPSVSINPFSAATVARCQGAETVSYTTTATNSTSITYTIDANSLAAGNSINSATGLVTYVATWSGNTIVTATAFGCGGPVSTVCTVTSAPLSVGGQISGGDVRVCHGTVPPNLTLSGHTGTILRWEISADSSFTNSTAIANGSEVLPGSVVGAITDMVYVRAVVRSGSCAFAYSNVVAFTLGSTSWNGSVWSEGEPDQYTTAFISANYTPTSDFTACRLFVSNNAVVSIPENVNVILSGALTVANGSTFILEHNSNLTQTAAASNAVNSGSIIVKEATPRLRRQDYALFSSPVIGQQLQSFSPNTLATRFYTYNPVSNVYAVVSSPSTTNFATGRGYLIRTPNNFPSTPTIWTASYVGTPFNGTLTIPVTTGSYNAVGNPYPSAIDADLFFDTNGLTEALYFYRKTNGTNATAYATYTKSGGVASLPDNSGNDGNNGNQGSNNSSSLAPDGTIAVGQGFIVKSTSSSIVFNNAMRVNSGVGVQLRRNVERHRIWLNMTSAAGFFSQTLIAYMTGATNGVDAAIDGRYFNDNQTALTTIINSEEYAIQGRQLPFVNSDIVSIGFKTEFAGTYTISLAKLDGLFLTGQVMFLKDKLTNTYTNIRTGSYTFSSVAGVFNDRFELRFTEPSTFYEDADGDGFGSAFNFILADTAPQGYVSNASDCDDTLVTVNMNASEIASNGIDDNCDGNIDEVTPLSSLITANCGITLSNMSTLLYARQLTGVGLVQGYRFRVTNGTNVRTFDSPVSRFSLAQLPGTNALGTVYTVEVSVKSNGFFRAYGLPCNVTTQATPNTASITNPSCGSTLTNISNVVYCSQVPSASGYRFRVRNGAALVGVVDRTVNRFSLADLGVGSISFGTTYTIDVLLAFNGVLRPEAEYGQTCTITTPAAPGSSRVIQPACGSTINSFWTAIYAQQVIGAGGYRFEVSTGGQSYYFDSAVSSFSLRNVVGLPRNANTTYTIRVAVLHNGVYGDFGSVCSLTTASVVSRMSENSSSDDNSDSTSSQSVSEIDFAPIPYPNPFVDSFRIAISQTQAEIIHVLVYDFSGKLLAKQIIFASEIESTDFGSNLPSGDYLLVVTQGSSIKSMHINKR